MLGRDMHVTDFGRWRDVVCRTRHFECEQCPLVMGGKMKSLYEKLPDWRMVLTWLVLTFVAAVAYFFPVARLVGSFID
jgi:hypothetical protein